VQLKQILEALKKSYQIILIDDGSTDKSWEILSALRVKDNHLKIIRFTRNFGQTAAIAAGFAQAKGEIIITMDADLQNDPADIPLLLTKIEQNYDLVSGWRKNRRDNLLNRKLPSWVANWLIRKIIGTKIHDYGCSLKAYKAWVVKNLSLYGEMHRFIPALATWRGAKITEIPVRHHPRQAGKSKYNLSRILKVILDLFTVKFLVSYASKPLHFLGLPGLFSLMTGFAICLYLSILKLIYHIHLSQRPLLFLGILLIVIGIQFISLGLLAELNVHIYHETQQKLPYVIKEIK
jgi:glycosyltransferase involved in cell wall biosynthesis